MTPTQVHSAVCGASDNATIVIGTPVEVLSANVFSINDAPVYLKLYDTGESPTAAMTPKLRIAAPANSTAANGAGNNRQYGEMKGVLFGDGLSFRVTKDIADSGTTALDAAEVIVEIIYRQVA